MKTITRKQYHQEIEDAAYYVWLRRESWWTPGNRLTDWFEGKLEIDTKIMMEQTVVVDA